MAKSKHEIRAINDEMRHHQGVFQKAVEFSLESILKEASVDIGSLPKSAQHIINENLFIDFVMVVYNSMIGNTNWDCAWARPNDDALFEKLTKVHTDIFCYGHSVGLSLHDAPILSYFLDSAIKASANVFHVASGKTMAGINEIKEHLNFNRCELYFVSTRTPTKSDVMRRTYDNSLPTSQNSIVTLN